MPDVFISYSHQDEIWKDRLQKQLGVLETQGLMRAWDDRQIGPGDEWLEEIRTALKRARVAVLLISANSLSSRFIQEQEIPGILDRRAREGLVVIPIIIRPCVWETVGWLSRLQVFPKDGRSLDSFRGHRRDVELANIARMIMEILKPEESTLDHESRRAAPVSDADSGESSHEPAAASEGSSTELGESSIAEVTLARKPQQPERTALGLDLPQLKIKGSLKSIARFGCGLAGGALGLLLANTGSGNVVNSIFLMAIGIALGLKSGTIITNRPLAFFAGCALGAAGGGCIGAAFGIMSKQIWEGFAFGALLFFLPAGLFYAVYRAANYPKIDGDSNLS